MGKTIGIVGGMGPYAGLDLVRKIHDLCPCAREQDYPEVMLFSLPGRLAPRPEFLLGQSPVNPGPAIGEQMVALARAGAQILAVPCHTAHAPPIMNQALARLETYNSQAEQPVVFVSLVETVLDELVRSRQMYGCNSIGLLGTSATILTGLYQTLLREHDFNPICPDPELQAEIQMMISDPVQGIKTNVASIPPRVSALMEIAVACLEEAGAQSVVLACTELPLALPMQSFAGIKIIDPTILLAKRLICCSE